MRPVWRKSIATLEAVGGIFGLVTVASQLAQGRPEVADRTLAGVVVAAYLLALFAGVMLWRDTRAGCVASVAAQLIQLPKLVSPQFAFMISYGVDFAPMVMGVPDQRGYWLSGILRIGSHHLVLGSPSGLPVTGFGLSIVSVVALRLLLCDPNEAVTEAQVGGEPARGRELAPSGLVSGPPEWVMPPWMKVLLILLGLMIAARAGLPLLR